RANATDGASPCPLARSAKPTRWPSDNSPRSHRSASCKSARSTTSGLARARASRFSRQWGLIGRVARPLLLSRHKAQAQAERISPGGHAREIRAMSEQTHLYVIEAPRMLGREEWQEK